MLVSWNQRGPQVLWSRIPLVRSRESPYHPAREDRGFGWNKTPQGLIIALKWSERKVGAHSLSSLLWCVLKLSTEKFEEMCLFRWSFEDTKVAGWGNQTVKKTLWCHGKSSHHKDMNSALVLLLMSCGTWGSQLQPLCLVLLKTYLYLVKVCSGLPGEYKDELKIQVGLWEHIKEGWQNERIILPDWFPF